jgi:hypothetical protein
MEWLGREDLPAIAGEDPQPPWILPPNEGANSAGEPKGDQKWITLRKPEEEAEPDKETDEVGRTRTYEVWGYVDGSTIGEAVEAWAERQSAENSIICPWALESHEQAAKFFCAGLLYRYFGDADIIKAALGDRKRPGKSCTTHVMPIAGGTYEPYAFVVSQLKFPELPKLITLALYGMFEDGTVERLFAGHFPDTKKSQFLSTLFRINSIPAGTDSHF